MLAGAGVLIGLVVVAATAYWCGRSVSRRSPQKAEDLLSAVKRLHEREAGGDELLLAAVELLQAIAAELQRRAERNSETKD
jgi:hypothetical protein